MEPRRAALTKAEGERYNPPILKARLKKIGGADPMKNFLDIAMIITSVALVASIVLQSKGAGLGGLTGGGDTGGVFSVRRGLEKMLFRITIILSVLFFSLAIYTVYISG